MQSNNSCNVILDPRKIKCFLTKEVGGSGFCLRKNGFLMLRNPDSENSFEYDVMMPSRTFYAKLFLGR